MASERRETVKRLKGFLWEPVPADGGYMTIRLVDHAAKAADDKARFEHFKTLPLSGDGSFWVEDDEVQDPCRTTAPEWVLIPDLSSEPECILDLPESFREASGQVETVIEDLFDVFASPAVVAETKRARQQEIEELLELAEPYILPPGRRIGLFDALHVLAEYEYPALSHRRRLIDDRTRDAMRNLLIGIRRGNRSGVVSKSVMGRETDHHSALSKSSPHDWEDFKEFEYGGQTWSFTEMQARTVCLLERDRRAEGKGIAPAELKRRLPGNSDRRMRDIFKSRDNLDFMKQYVDWDSLRRVYRLK